MINSPVRILSDDDGNLVGVDGDRLRVTAAIGGGTPDDSTYVTITRGDQKYHTAYFVNSALPASVEAAGSAPYNVGGTDLTVTIDGEGTPTVVSFPTRAATKGYAVGGTNPWPKDGWPNEEHKIKVSVDGGELTEVEITKKAYNSWTEVATALQTAIRASVPNGSNVNVEFNSTEFPLRMAMWSGTTGASSSIIVRKGDDLAKDMQLMPGYDYTEVDGTDANYYREFEVRDLIDSGLHDVIVIDSPITITTRSAGTSASLQVASGGANTALQFPTTLVSGQNGTGSQEMSEDGSTTPLFYSPEIPEGETFVVSRIILIMRCSSADLKKFGAIDELTNGIAIEFRQEGQLSQTAFTAGTNAELLTYMGGGEVMVDAYDGGNELIHAVKTFDPGIRIREGTVDKLQIKVQDDLSDVTKLVWFNAIAEGWLE